jgi:hypothetical protein
MKPILKSIAAIAATFALVGAVTALQAEEKKDQKHEEHDHEHEEAAAGPNGGKVLHGVEPHLEFLVTEDRKVKITALGEDGKAIPIGDQTVSVTGGSRSNPTRMSFAKSGDVLVSDSAFPEGNDFPVVVQIKTTPDAKAAIEKFNLNLNDCPTCKYKEYACICDHGDHDGHDHDGHKKKE